MSGTHPDLHSRATYHHWARDVIRFCDTDILGHVSNVAYSAYIETGRVGFYYEHLQQVTPPDYAPVLRHLAIDFRAETHYPGELDIGSRLQRIGRTSLVVANGVFCGETCAATGLSTLVIISRTTRRPVEIAGELRSRLEDFLLS